MIPECSNWNIPPIPSNFDDLFSPDQSFLVYPENQKRQRTSSTSVPAKEKSYKARKCSREKQRRLELNSAFGSLSERLNLKKKTEKIKILKSADLKIQSLEEQVKFLSAQLKNEKNEIDLLCRPIRPKLQVVSGKETLSEMKSLVEKVESLYELHSKSIENENKNTATHCA